MKDFKVLSEAHDSYHVQHAGGRTFTVDKKGLSPKAQAAIQKLCMGGDVKGYSSGGSIEDDFAADAQAKLDADELAKTQTQARADAELEKEREKPLPETFAGPGEGAMSNDSPFVRAQAAPPVAPAAAPASQIEETSRAPASPAPMESASPMSPVVPSAEAPGLPVAQPAAADPYTTLLNNKSQRLDQRAGELGQFEKQASQAYGEQAKAYKDLSTGLNKLEDPQEIFKRHQAADMALQDQLTNQKIDPSRYMHNQSTGSKILAAIGLALSGAGAGANGKNLAAEHLNKAIESDIDAQKSDQSNTMNLWKMNRENTKNEMEANLATRNQLLTIAQSKAQMAGNQIQSATGRLQIQGLIQDLQAQKDKNNLIRSQMSGNGGTAGADPTVLLQGIQAPPEHIKKALDEVEVAQDSVRNRDKILQAFDDAAKEQTTLKTFGGLRESEGVKRLKQAMLPLFKDIDGTVRQAAMDESFHNIVPKDGDSDIFGTTAGRKRALVDWVDSKQAAPMFRYLTGIPLSSFQSTAHRDTSQIQTMNGVQYKKVQGGWQKVGR